MPSSVPAAKGAIRTLIEANTWPGTPPTFSWGAPTETEDIPKTGELVYFDGVDMTEDHVVLGGTRGDESYSLRVVIETRLEGDDEQAVEQRGWELYDSLRALLEQHKNLIETPGQLIVRLEDRRVRQANAVGGPDQWLCRIVVDQQVVGLVFNP